VLAFLQLVAQSVASKRQKRPLNLSAAKMLGGDTIQNCRSNCSPAERSTVSKH
jgi:hypothetical protein